MQKSLPRRYTCQETGKDPKREIIGGVLTAGGGRSATTKTVAGSALTTPQARTPHFQCLKRASAEAVSVRLLFVAVGAASLPSVSGADSPFRVAVRRSSCECKFAVRLGCSVKSEALHPRAQMGRDQRTHAQPSHVVRRAIQRERSRSSGRQDGPPRRCRRIARRVHKPYRRGAGRRVRRGRSSRRHPPGVPCHPSCKAVESRWSCLPLWLSVRPTLNGCDSASLPTAAPPTLTQPCRVAVFVVGIYCTDRRGSSAARAAYPRGRCAHTPAQTQGVPLVI